jgi:hypothetical protein
MDKAYELADKVFDWARAARPSQPLTICVWNNDTAFATLNHLALERSDIITYHNYEPAASQKAAIDSEKVWQANYLHGVYGA